MSLNKIANDLALMGSGPRAGLAELRLPALQKGSSIMPGKVNPVICEVVIQVADQVIGNDAAITIAGSQGQFELNVRVPLIARNLLDSIKLLAAACRLLDTKCVQGIEADEEVTERHAEATLATATALNPHIGYDRGDRDRQGGARVRPAAARGRARDGRRRGDPRRGARPPQDGAPARLAVGHRLDKRSATPSGGVRKLDGQPYEPCTSPKTYTGLAPGQDTLGVAAIFRRSRAARSDQPARFATRVRRNAAALRSTNQQLPSLTEN